MATSKPGLMDLVKQVAFRLGTRGARVLVETALLTARTVDALQARFRETLAGARASSTPVATIFHAPSAPDATMFRAPSAPASTTAQATSAPTPRAPSAPTSTVARAPRAPARATSAEAPPALRSSTPRRGGRGTGTLAARTGAATSVARSGTTPSTAERRRAAVTPRGAIESGQPAKTPTQAPPRRKAPARPVSDPVETAGRERGRKSIPGHAAAAKRGTPKKAPVKVKRSQKHRH